MTPAASWTSTSNGADRRPFRCPPGTRALKFPNQGRFHPLKYCAGLALAIQKRGGQLFSRHRLCRP